MAGRFGKWSIALAALALLAIVLTAAFARLFDAEQGGPLQVSFQANRGSGAGESSEASASPATSQASRGSSGSAVPIAHISIPALGVDQPAVKGSVDSSRNEMIAPRGAFDIAYYEYSARPGMGNAVFSGHVDYVGVGPAVFWNLRKLKPGDLIIIRMDDGNVLRYAVRFNRVYDAEHGPWGQLFGPDAAADIVTLYTCDGNFDRHSASYDERRVVRAERVG